MRLRSFSALLVMPLVASQTANAQSPRTQPLSAGAVTAQITTGVLGTAVGFVGGGLTTRWAAFRLGASEEKAGRAGTIGAYASSVLVTAIGPAAIGSRHTSNGSFGAAVGGSAGGLVTAAVLRKIGRTGVFGERGPIAFLVGVTIVALPSIGATLAYNATR